MIRSVVLELDELDYDAVQRALSERQRMNHQYAGGSILPDGEGNYAGRNIAEICRGWLEFLEWSRNRS
jgi:hypothetical protein